MHYVGHVDWAFADHPVVSSTSSGLARAVLVGPEVGSVHTELALGAMPPSGWLARHVHSFEEALYVLEGELVLELDQRVHRLVAGDYALDAHRHAPHAGQRRSAAGPLALGQHASPDDHRTRPWPTPCSRRRRRMSPP